MTCPAILRDQRDIAQRELDFLTDPQHVFTRAEIARQKAKYNGASCEDRPRRQVAKLTYAIDRAT